MRPVVLAVAVALSLMAPPLPQQQQPPPQPGPSLAAREQQAKQAMADGHFDEAARAYRDLLQAVPNEPGLLMNLGMALAMGGHVREAIDPLTAATRLRPTLQPAWLFLGSAYLESGEPEKAIAPLRRFVTAQPAHVESRQMLATALLMSGHPTEALTQFQRLAKLAPKDAKTWAGLAQCYDAQTQDALDHLRRATDASADAFRSLVLAEALESDEKNEQAFALYRQALDVLPQHAADIREAIARIYDKTGHTVWAAAERGKPDAVPPKCPAAAAANAACAFRGGHYVTVLTSLTTRTDAESEYWRARAYAELAVEALNHLSDLPPSRELHELKAELFRNHGRHLQSIEELKSALTFAPDDPRLQKELAKSYLLTRDPDHAKPILQALLTRDRDSADAEVPLLYGEILLEAQRVEEALPYLKAAAAKDPSSLNAHAALGRALVQTGQNADAIPHLKAALPQDEDGSLHYQLARAYQATGQPDLAKPLLEQYQSMQQASQSRVQATTPNPKITPP